MPRTIEGKVDISATGSETYSIPVLVSPGSNKMQPNLSLEYNSNSSNDILGYGWRLGGLSSITRVPKINYYDGIYSPAKYGSINVSDTTDDLILDGQRLILNSSGTNWSPENDPYTIVSYSNGIFTVTTKDNIVSEYGNPTDNAQVNSTASNSTIISWNIDRITDQNGNYIVFNYIHFPNEYHISQILYTGSPSSSPYDTINFNYVNRKDVDTSNLIYVGNNALRLNSTKLLSQITVKDSNSVSKEYDFSYYNDGIYSKLNQISLTARMVYQQVRRSSPNRRD